MNAIRQTSGFGTLGLAMLALAGIGFVSPGKAAASCGDYVMMGHATARDGKAPGVPADQPRKPCHGPMCSGAPASMPVTSAPSVPPRAGEWGFSIASPIVAQVTAPLPVFEVACGQPVSHGSEVYHPPR